MSYPRQLLRRSTRIVMLKDDIAQEIANDRLALLMALLIVALAGVALALTLTLETYRYSGVLDVGDLSGFLLVVPLLAVWVFLLDCGFLIAISKLLGRHKDTRTFCAAFGTGFVIFWALPIPIFGWLLSLWILPVQYKLTTTILGLPRPVAFLMILLTGVPLLLTCFLPYFINGMFLTGSLL